MEKVEEEIEEIEIKDSINNNDIKEDDNIEVSEKDI